MAVWQRLLYFVFVVLFGSTLCISSPVLSAGSLPATAADITPLKTGDRAASFTVRTVENASYEFDPAGLQKPTVLISFRGGWCPYCNLHLSELRNVLPEIRSLGFDVLFISNDRPELLYSSLENETREYVEDLDYTILSDAELQAALAFGTAFQIPDGVVPYLQNKGKDYQGSSIDKLAALAVPAVYVVNTEGRIVFDFVNADYKVRLPAEELLQVARGLSGN